MDRLIKDKAQPHYDAKIQVSNVTRIANVLGIKDPYTREHARRVAIYARRLSERIGLNATAVENIRLGGLPHLYRICNSKLSSLILKSIILHTRDRAVNSIYQFIFRQPNFF